MGLVAATFWTMTSVALRVSPTPVQVVQLVVADVPAVSKDAVDPEGGTNSTKFNPNWPDAAPDRFTVTEIVPAVPLRL